MSCALQLLGFCLTLKLSNFFFFFLEMILAMICRHRRLLCSDQQHVNRERAALWWGVNMTPEGLGWGSLIAREKNLINSFRPKPKPILKLFHSCNLTISTYFNITLIFMTINPLLDQGFPEWEGSWVRGTTQIIFFNRALIKSFICSYDNNNHHSNKYSCILLNFLMITL